MCVVNVYTYLNEKLSQIFLKTFVEKESDARSKKEFENVIYTPTKSVEFRDVCISENKRRGNEEYKLKGKKKSRDIHIDGK